MARSSGEVGHGSISALNQRVIGVIQIESPQAVDSADEIAAIDGVDVLFVGPTDLSHSMGIPGQFDDPAFIEALRRVVAATEAHGKTAGILPAQRLRRRASTATSASGSSGSAPTVPSWWTA